MAKGQQEQAFDKAIFAAKKGKLTGPIKTQFGWYVFEVTEGHAGQASRRSTRPRPRSSRSCVAEPADGAEEVRRRTTRSRYKKTTDCRKGYVVDDCKNAPKAKAATTTAPASTTGAQQQPQPATDRLAVGPRRRRRRLGSGAMPSPTSPPPSPVSTSSRAVCGASARGTASRTSARSCPTPSRRPTSWPTPPTPATTPSCCDELGDVLFQVHFLSLLLEERGAGDLAQVAEHVRQKLIRRHPHVFGEVEVADRRRGAAQLGRDQARRARPRAGDLRRGAREPAGACCTRARSSAAPPPRASTSIDVPYDAVAGELEELEAAGGDRDAAFHEVGDVLFAAVNVARKLHVDPELALRSASDALPRPRGGGRASWPRRPATHGTS